VETSAPQHASQAPSQAGAPQRWPSTAIPSQTPIPQPPPAAPPIVPVSLVYRPANLGASLCKAAENGDNQLVQNLLNAGVLADAADDRGFTALQRAVQQGHEPIVQLLLSRGASVTAQGPGGLHALHIAVMAQDLALARLLIAHGADREHAPSGATPFHLAVSTGCAEMVDLLVEMGADPKAKVTGEAGLGETALHMAVAAWHDELLPRLLRLGLDVNAQGLKPAGQSALHIAAWYGYESAAKLLLEAGANVNARFADGQTALHRAAEHGQVNMCELLLERGADVMAATPVGDTALCVAALYGKDRVVTLLLDKSQELMSELQKTRVLISAAGTGRVETARLLLERGFDVNGTGPGGVTALDLAARYAHEQVVILLLENKANPGIFGVRSRTSAQWAAMEGHTRIVGLIDGLIPLRTEAQPPPGQPDLIDSAQLAWSLSLATTFASKRRIMANPNPGGFPARCNVCQDLNFRRGVPKDAEVVHWVLDSSLAMGESRGCSGCTMIRQCLHQLASIYGETLAAWTAANVPCQLLSMVHGGPLYVSCEKPFGSTRPTLRVEIYSQPGTFQPSERNGDHRASSRLP
jgi:uncharacterized protein